MSGTTDVGVRLLIVLSIGAVTLGFVWTISRFVDESRRRALSTTPNPLKTIIEASEDSLDDANIETASIRVCILAFSSEDCSQCHTLQAPVLRRVREACGDTVKIIDIDAPASPKLTQLYHVLTVPTTVLLDAQGKAHAVNYGFTNAQCLIKQVDEILALDVAQEALP